MTAFSLPSTQADNKAAFFDANSAADWLARQPQANASAMLSELVTQIQAYNTYDTAPRDRFKTLEVLRKTIFAVSGDCQRRYENKPLPLLPAEQSVLDSVRCLWRTCAVAYLHCLQACLERDTSITSNSGKVAHRALSCLRMEQLNGYLASAEPEGELWRILHSVFASAERLGVTLEPVEDRLLGETSESTASGQYCMALLLHLACPSSLTRSHFAAATRWLARWREQAKIVTRPDADPKSCCIGLDLSQDRPIHDNLRAASDARWLSLYGVLRKMRKRVEMLTAGESPESLKLGSGLSSESCISLLTQISDHLRFPQQPEPDLPPGAASVLVAAGLENIHRVLGGKGLNDPMASSSLGSKLSADQIAVFGHVVETENSKVTKIENWWLLRKEADLLQLRRPADCGDARMVLKGLLAIQLPQFKYYVLASISQLELRGEKSEASLSVAVNLYHGEPVPLVAESREKGSGKILRYPAFMLPAEEKSNKPVSIILPAGVTARALSIRLYDTRERSPLDWQLAELIERNADSEHWSLIRLAPEG